MAMAARRNLGGGPVGSSNVRSCGCGSALGSQRRVDDDRGGFFSRRRRLAEDRLRVIGGGTGEGGIGARRQIWQKEVWDGVCLVYLGLRP